MFGKRTVGKPKKRWMDAVKEDTQMEKLGDESTEQRWRSRIKKACFGL
jgi:hypothetical protein